MAAQIDGGGWVSGRRAGGVVLGGAACGDAFGGELGVAESLGHRYLAWMVEPVRSKSDDEGGGRRGRTRRSRGITRGAALLPAEFEPRSVMDRASPAMK